MIPVSARAYMLCVLKILEEYSDADHILSNPEIREHMRKDYDADVDRRTVSASIDGLIDLGYKISIYEENRKGYYLEERLFTPSEIRLLFDAIYGCSYLSSTETKKLLEKLRSILSQEERKQFKLASIVNPDKKSPNTDVIENIALLEEAINGRKQVSFTYLKYNDRKQLVPRRERPYIVNPYAMVCENEKYYLVLIPEGHKDIGLYRIDMMKDLKILKQKISISKEDANLENTEKIIYAYSGKPVSITLSCDEIGLRYCIEKFGKDISILPKDGRYIIVLRAAKEGMLYFALQYIEHIEVQKPETLRRKIVETIKKSSYYE